MIVLQKLTKCFVKRWLHQWFQKFWSQIHSTIEMNENSLLRDLITETNIFGIVMKWPSSVRLSVRNLLNCPLVCLLTTSSFKTSWFINHWRL
jgi:hypothetical protein